jgi:hypothetical protein
MRKTAISAVIIWILIISTLLVIEIADEAQALGADDEVRLYLKDDGLMKTTPSTLSDDVIIKPILPGQEAITYDTSFPLTRDLEIEGNRSGGGQVMVLHLFGSTASPSDEHTLDVRVVEIASGGGETQLAAGRFEGPEMLEDYLELDLTSGSGTTILEGSFIQLRIQLEGPSGIFSGFGFGHYGNPESSYLSFRGEPILEEDIGMKIMDSTGAELEELLPNGPEDARTFDLSISVMDAFGAYDIQEINILLTSESDNVIWNFTGTPTESGGEAIAYLNESFTIPEGTPEGNYMLRATVVSNTDQTVIAADFVKVASGLQVSIRDPEREADAGETLEFSVSILNGGEGTDRVTFTHSSRLGWTVEDPDPIEVAGGDTETVIFRVQVPIRSSLGDEDTIDINIESRNSDKTYSREVKVTVVSVAEFGVEILGDGTGAVVAGGGAPFSISIINIEDSPSSFEIGIEDIPAGWSVSYSGSNGTMQGSLFILEIEGDSDGTVNINIMTSTSSEGTYPITAYVRKQGESEKRSVYFKVRVVDPSRSVMELKDTTDTKQSGRAGSNLPIEYATVYFTLELYNPTLEDSRLRINVFAPTEWEIQYDYGTVDLLPGEASSWNISITPRDGEFYQSSPFETEVEIDGGSLGTFKTILKVELKKVSSLSIITDKDSMDIVKGEVGLVNVTIRNNGNHEALLTITIEAPPALQVSSDIDQMTIATDDEGKARLKVEVIDTGDGDSVTFTLGYDMDGIKGEKDILVYPMKSDEGSKGPDFILIAGIVAAVVIAAVAGFFLYSRFSKKKKTAPSPPTKKGQPSMEGVRITSVPDRSEESGKPVKAPRSKTVEEADNLAASLLGDDTGRMELSGGVTVEVGDEPEIVTAEVVE